MISRVVNARLTVRYTFGRRVACEATFRRSAELAGERSRKCRNETSKNC